VGGVAIAVATFGDDSWRHTAETHALASAETFGVPVVYRHAETLWGARNECLQATDTEHIIYLDADDELEPGYVDAMMRGPEADVRVPHVRYVTPGQPEPQPVMPRVVGHRHHRPCRPQCLRDGNWIVIGAMARTQMVRDVGGWRDYGYEDYDMWLRCHLAGYTIDIAPGAVYRANVNPGSRGRYTAAESLRHHRAVAAANGVPSP
jgi:glycosyltransferase involved in cell wall biosynthesis